MSQEQTQKPNKATSSRKAEANRRNAQLSTGPKTPEGKAKSSQNAITHGIFVKNFLNGASPEAAAEIEALAAGIWEHYKPVGAVEEMLAQKIVIEAAREHRVMGLEQKFENSTSGPLHLVACLEHVALRDLNQPRAVPSDSRARARPGRTESPRELRCYAGCGTARSDYHGRAIRFGCCRHACKREPHAGMC